MKKKLEQKMNIIKTDQDNITILTELYCEINEFMNTFSCVLDKYLIGTRHQRPFSRMSTSEIMTILIGFQMIGGHNFKEYYKDTVLQFHRCEFPTIVSYNRFVELSKVVIVPLMMFLKFRMEMVPP